MAEQAPGGLLLDTHAWIWYVGGDPRLVASLRVAIDDARPDVWLSPASIWELGTLVARGRVSLDRSFRDWVERSIEGVPLRDAAVTRSVGIATESLPTDERDPADRMIAATALIYGLELVTADRKLIAADWLPTRSR